MVATTELIVATGSAASRLVPIRNGILDQMMGSFGSVDRGGQRPRALHVDLLLRSSPTWGPGEVSVGGGGAAAAAARGGRPPASTSR